MSTGHPNQHTVGVYFDVQQGPSNIVVLPTCATQHMVSLSHLLDNRRHHDPYSPNSRIFDNELSKQIMVHKHPERKICFMIPTAIFILLAS